MDRSPRVVLGIESSCDETGAGLVRDGQLLGHAVASSMAEHARYGGVVPEIAARAHVHALQPVVRQALDQAGLTLSDVGAVAVTTGPGLSGALQVGLAGAKGLAYGLGVPLYGVHHLAGHVAADTLDHGPLPDPCVVLIVSGGHTSLLLVRDLAREPIVHLGDTLDDAAGECFDKVARVFGLPYPGGPAIDRAARDGDRRAVPFPRPMTGSRDARYGFSFSGLKTAAARWVEQHRATGAELPVADGAASLQEAVADVLTRKAVAACREHHVPTLVVVGGVAANSRVRALAEDRCRSAGIELRVPRLDLCTDNGAMIAAVGDLLVRAGAEPAPLDLSIDPSAPLEYAALTPGRGPSDDPVHAAAGVAAGAIGTVAAGASRVAGTVAAGAAGSAGGAAADPAATDRAGRAGSAGAGLAGGARAAGGTVAGAVGTAPERRAPAADTDATGTTSAVAAGAASEAAADAAGGGSAAAARGAGAAREARGRSFGGGPALRGGPSVAGGRTGGGPSLGRGPSVSGPALRGGPSVAGPSVSGPSVSGPSWGATTPGAAATGGAPAARGTPGAPPGAAPPAPEHRAGANDPD